MSVMKRFISTMLLGVLCIFVLVGCGDGSNIEKNGNITQLKMILIGDTPSRYEEIYGKLNEMLREDIGAEVSVEYIPYSAKTDKYPLLFSSNENFDIVFTGNWLDYNSNASKNSFYELTEDFIAENAPKTYETVPKSAWKQATVNGKIYMIPNTALEYEDYIYIVRGDFRKKLGLDELKTAEDFEAYLTGLAQKYPEITPITDLNAIAYIWSTNADENYRENFGGYRNGIMYAWDDNTGTPIYNNMTDRYERYIYKVRDFVDKGVIPADLVSNKSVANMFENGVAGTYVANLETAVNKYKTWSKAHPEWELELCDFSGDKPMKANSYINNGLSINRNSKNPEKAMQFIELLRNDERYFNLTWYGVEGEDWEDKGDGVIHAIPDEKGDYFDLGCNWGWKNQSMLKVRDDELPFKLDTMEKWVTNTYENPAANFVADDSNVKNELAALSSATTQYAQPLQYGMIEKSEIPAALQEMRSQVTKAGIEKILSDFDKQIKEFLAE